MTDDHLPDDHLPRICVFDELRHLGVLHSRRQVDRLEAAGNFPKRVSMGIGRVGWITADIIKYVDARIANRSMAIGTLGSDNGPKRRQPVRVAPLLGKAATDAATAQATAKREAKAMPRKSA